MYLFRKILMLICTLTWPPRPVCSSVCLSVQLAVGSLGCWFSGLGGCEPVCPFVVSHSVPHPSMFFQFTFTSMSTILFHIHLASHPFGFVLFWFELLAVAVAWWNTHATLVFVCGWWLMMMWHGDTPPCYFGLALSWFQFLLVLWDSWLDWVWIEVSPDWFSEHDHSQGSSSGLGFLWWAAQYKFSSVLCSHTENITAILHGMVLGGQVCRISACIQLKESRSSN